MYARVVSLLDSRAVRGVETIVPGLTLSWVLAILANGGVGAVSPLFVGLAEHGGDAVWLTFAATAFAVSVAGEAARLAGEARPNRRVRERARRVRATGALLHAVFFGAVCGEVLAVQPTAQIVFAYLWFASLAAAAFLRLALVLDLDRSTDRR